MFDYINAIYYGDPIHMPVPTQLDDPDSTLSRHLERVRREMGGPFAQKLDGPCGWSSTAPSPPHFGRASGWAGS